MDRNRNIKGETSVGGVIGDGSANIVLSENNTVEGYISFRFFEPGFFDCATLVSGVDY